MELTLDSVKEFLTKNYNEDSIVSDIDEAMADYLNDDWEDEYEDEYEAYQETGRGEAESQVRMGIEKEILEHYSVSYDEYEETTGECIWDTIKGVYEPLDVD